VYESRTFFVLREVEKTLVTAGHSIEPFIVVASFGGTGGTQPGQRQTGGSCRAEHLAEKSSTGLRIYRAHIPLLLKLSVFNYLS
jgi:hypothetical protein